MISHRFTQICTENRYLNNKIYKESDEYNHDIPQNEDDLAIYTINGNTYVSKDRSEEGWKEILVEGKVN